MKGKNATIFSLLALLSLLLIAIVFFQSVNKKRLALQEQAKRQLNILGEKIEMEVVPTVSENVNAVIKDSFEGTKEVVSQKFLEAKQSITSSLEKEVTTMTQSQVDALKVQVCRDWGVFPSSPTPSVKP